MYTHPPIVGQLTDERQHDTLAQAGQQRLACKRCDPARASQRAERAGSPLTRPPSRARPVALPS